MKLKKKFMKNGKEIELVFRYPRLSDAKAAMEYINSFVDEKASIDIEKKMSLKKEKKYLKKLLKEIRKNKQVSVFAFHRKMLVGTCSVKKQETNSYKHRAVIGVGVHKDYRRIGLGKFLMNMLIGKAKEKFKAEILTLNVYGKNKIAWKLYKKLGFRIAGKVPKGIKKYGKYQDDILMYKKVI